MKSGSALMMMIPASSFRAISSIHLYANSEARSEVPNRSSTCTRSDPFHRKDQMKKKERKREDEIDRRNWRWNHIPVIIFEPLKDVRKMVKDVGIRMPAATIRPVESLLIGRQNVRLGRFNSNWLAVLVLDRDARCHWVRRVCGWEEMYRAVMAVYDPFIEFISIAKCWSWWMNQWWSFELMSCDWDGILIIWWSIECGLTASSIAMIPARWSIKR